jgi:hypothetical protein
VKVFTLSEMKGGWFIGDFEPTCLRTPAFEAAAKQYRSGDSEAPHVHRIAREITLIVSGRVRMNGREFSAGAIILVEPGEAVSFDALDDTTTFVVKTPSVAGDKYQ